MGAPIAMGLGALATVASRFRDKAYDWIMGTGRSAEEELVDHDLRMHSPMGRADEEEDHADDEEEEDDDDREEDENDVDNGEGYSE